MKQISTVGVIGAGTMGSALAQRFAQDGFAVRLIDRMQSLVERGLGAINQSLAQAVDRRIFSETEAAAIRARIVGSSQLDDVAPCDLVVEAIYEDFQAKCELFRALGALLAPDAIVATNTSSFSVADLASSITHPERFCGMHFFYHAAKNRLVEIIAGPRTSADTLRVAERFAFETNKDPIVCRDRPGFAVNRFFVPWLNEAVRLLHEGVASISQIDAVCVDAFEITMGPFALMNATGVQIALHAQRTLECNGTLYSVCERLVEQGTRNDPWLLNDGSSSEVDEATARTIRERMLGIVFLICGQIIDERVCTPTELNRGARIGLKWSHGPVEMMQRLGWDTVARLVRAVANRYQTAFPNDLADLFRPLSHVRLDRVGRTAVIRMTRPEDLNALNIEVVEGLAACMAEAEADPEIDSIVLTGTGKAFVAGADISLFVENIRNGTIDRIVSFTARTQEVFDAIDRSSKHVVALLNGMTLGGGMELALCADRIYALPDARLAYPETGIGIYPGLGGTQRTQRRIGRGLTKYMIYTGDTVNARQAADIGLIDGVMTVDEYFGALETGDVNFAQRNAREREARWNEIEGFFASAAIDRILLATPCELSVAAEDCERWSNRVRQKAPIALRAAERLVDEARGCASELELLSLVFTSNDALLGLTSIGKRVSFNGN